MDDRSSPVYGTVGYQAPEIAETGPTRATDLFTVGRTLAVLCTVFAGYQSTYRFTLPARGDVELYARHGSLHRLLLRATAPDPDARFQTADEMSAQLVGVLREIVAGATGTPAPGVSTTFTAPGRGSTDVADRRALPTPLVDPDDPLAAVILAIGPAGPEAIAEQRSAIQASNVHASNAPGSTSALDLWLARALVDDDRIAEATAVLDAVGRADPWDWRVPWYRAIAALADGAPSSATRELELVLATLPGELAPKLALGVAAELAGDPTAATAWYEIVSRTDPGFTSAAFGLARCHAALGDRDGAVAAYGRVPDTSSAHVDARIAEARLLVTDGAAAPADVRRAATIVEQLPLDAEQRGVLAALVLEASLGLLDRGVSPDPAMLVLGFPFTDRDIRRALEATYRSSARRAATPAERVTLVERANRVRPRSLL
jgi:serine/threonine-protein kinase PknG